MCAHAGVDPLASRKNAWSELLGLGDFYYKLGLQIVEICLASRTFNGGLMALPDLMQALNRRVTTTNSSSTTSLSFSDLAQALKKLRELKGGYEVVNIGGQTFVRSIPGGLSDDHREIVGVARESKGRVSLAQLVKVKGWAQHRAADAINRMLLDGLAMVDDGDPSGETFYWLQALCPQLNQ